MLELEDKVTQLQNQLVGGGDQTTRELLRQAKIELRQLHTEEAKRIWREMQDRIYQWGINHVSYCITSATT